MPPVPAGIVVVVTCKVAMVMAMLKVLLFPWLCVGVCESVTVTMKLDVPAEDPVGVPEITPALLKLKPAGKLPVSRAQV